MSTRTIASIADDSDVDAVVSYAAKVLADPGRVLRGFGGDQRERFLRLLFPRGVTWEGKGFQTPVTGSVFACLQELSGPSAKVVPPAGVRRPL
jgi:hypothetical protein